MPKRKDSTRDDLHAKRGEDTDRALAKQAAIDAKNAEKSATSK